MHNVAQRDAEVTNKSTPSEARRHTEDFWRSGWRPQRKVLMARARSVGDELALRQGWNRWNTLFIGRCLVVAFGASRKPGAKGWLIRYSN